MARDIGAWLEGLGLGRYAVAFGENVIDPRPLPEIEHELDALLIRYADLEMARSKTLGRLGHGRRLSSHDEGMFWPPPLTFGLRRSGSCCAAS